MSMPSPTQAEVQADLDRQRAIMYGPIALTQSPIAPAAPQPRPEPPKPQFMSPEMQRAIYGRQSITSLDHPAPHTPHPTPHETLVTGRGMPPSIPREGAPAGCLAGLRLLERLLAGGLINPSALTVRGEAMACVDAMKKELCE